MIISIDTEKAFNKIQHIFMIKKNFLESGHRGNIHQHNKKVMYDKPTANIMLNGENLNAFLLRSGTT